jgi:uncharacterized lipoprotein YmbA
MNHSNFKLGDEVLFGRPNGEKTRGIIVKLNPKKAKVQTLENRGRNRSRGAGVTWSVPYSLMTHASQGTISVTFYNGHEKRYDSVTEVESTLKNIINAGQTTDNTPFEITDSNGNEYEAVVSVKLVRR